MVGESYKTVPRSASKRPSFPVAWVMGKEAPTGVIRLICMELSAIVYLLRVQRNG